MAICALFFTNGYAQSKSSKTLQLNRKSSEINKKPTEKLATVYEGKGLEGIVVGKSTMGDVMKKFGTYRWEVNKKYSYQMTYDKLGLSFYICQSDKLREVFLIEIKSPYKAKTSKGIILGKSTKEETEKIYGAPNDGFEYPGISFYYNKFGSRNVISEIDITEKSGIRQCKVNK